MLGLGGGWFEREHDAFGIDFGDGFGDRLDRLDEAVGLIRRLLDGERVTHDGRFYRMRDALVRSPARPAAAADPDRWVRPDQDAPHDRPLRRPVERLRPARPDRRDQRHPARALRRDRPPVRRHRAHRRRSTPSSATATADADAAWDETARHHGIVGRIGADGTGRGLTVGGPPAEVDAYLDGYRELGIGEVVFVFRAPFDLETIGRLGELRS